MFGSGRRLSQACRVFLVYVSRDRYRIPLHSAPPLKIQLRINAFDLGIQRPIDVCLTSHAGLEPQHPFVASRPRDACVLFINQLQLLHLRLCACFNANVLDPGDPNRTTDWVRSLRRALKDDLSRNLGTRLGSSMLLLSPLV